MSLKSFQPGDRVILSKPNALEPWGIHIGDIGTVERNYAGDTMTIIKFDKPLSNPSAFGDKLAVHNVTLSYYIPNGFQHRAKLAWQRGDYNLL